MQDNHKTVDETYDYGDGCFVDRILTGETQENGKPEKTFQQYQCQGKEKIFKGFKKLYPKPELRVWPGQFFIAEGERKVNKLMEMGFAAICNVGGSGGWLDIYADEIPRDQTVFIWPDNDTATDKWVAKIVESLSRRGIKYHILSALNAGLPPKGDVVDWVKVPGNTAEKLMAEVDSYRPVKHRYHESELEEIPPIEWLLEPFIQDRALNMLAGPSGTGKSYIALNWGKELSRKFNVLYIAVEDYSQYPERIKAWNLYHNFDPREGKFYLETLPMNLTNEEDAERIIKENDDIKPRFVVIDTWAAATAGSNENDNGQIELILVNAKKFIRAWGCAVLLIHHFNKAETAERGGSALKAGIVQALQATIEQDSVKISMDKLRNTEKTSDYFYNFEKIEITVKLSDGTTRTRRQQVPILSEHATTNMAELTPSQEAILNYLGAALRRDNEYRPVDLETALGQPRRTMSDNLAKLKSMKLVNQLKDRGPYKITRDGLLRIGYISEDLGARIEEMENW